MKQEATSSMIRLQPWSNKTKNNLILIQTIPIESAKPIKTIIWKINKTHKQIYHKNQMIIRNNWKTTTNKLKAIENHLQLKI